jgi:hypothetical protein
MALTPIKFGIPLDMGQLEILGFRLEQIAGDPISPVNGQIWYNTVSHIAKIYMNGFIILFYSSADALKLIDVESTADAAEVSATMANSEITNITSDNVLSKNEKPSVKLQYDTIIVEQSGIDTLATTYGVTTEKTNYDNAVTALTLYITGLSPLYTDFTTNTVMVGTTFRSRFASVYSTKQILLNKISDIAKIAIDSAQGVADAAVPTADAAAAAAHQARTQTVIDYGLITTGTLEVGDGIIGSANAGITGIVSGTPDKDIRFWSGDTYANRTTAPFRVQNDGTMFAFIGNIGGWIVDSDSIFTGVKCSGNGYSASPGDITIRSNGSIHAKNFYVNADGTTSIAGIQLTHSINKAASATPRNYHNDPITTGSGSYVKLKTITLSDGLVGQARFVFDHIGKAIIYRNGVPLGTEQSNGTTSYVTKSEDITQTWNPGDTCELWACMDTGNGVNEVGVRNFRICYDDAPIVMVASVNS